MNTNWNAKVAKTEWSGGTLNIYITYFNEDESISFTEVISTQDSQSDTWLKDQINNRLSQLNGLGVYEANINNDPVISEKMSFEPQVIKVAPAEVII